MAALANALLFPGGFGGTSMPANDSCIGKSGCQKYRSQFLGVFHSNKVQYLFGRKQYYPRNQELFHGIKCVKKDGQFDPSSIEPPPYYSYMDSASGQLEPASGDVKPPGSQSPSNRNQNLN